MLGIIIIPIISLLAIFTFIGSAIGMIGLLAYTVGYMCATVIVAYAFANTLLEKNNKNPYLMGILGILIIEILRRLPVIGGVISFIIICIAFGTIIKLIKNSNTKKEEVITSNNNE